MIPKLLVSKRTVINFKKKEYFLKTCFGKTYAIFTLPSDVCKTLNRNYRMNKLTKYSDRCYVIRR